MYHYCARPKRITFNSDWVPFYLGVSQNIHTRVYEHLEHHDEKYSSLKLSHLIDANSCFCDFPIRLSIAEINDITIGRRYIIVREAEGILREQLHPIIGRQ
jgi:hypothetical protein